MNEFRFGLESEYMLAESKTGRALWHTDLTFDALNRILEAISLEGIPSLEGLELEKPHRKRMPYVVEGYGLPDENFQPRDILPKGVEIRTPVCDSVASCLKIHGELLHRLGRSLGTQGWVPVALSHHPEAVQFSGPQNKKRHDYWQWSMEVMTTYGPDFNVGLPQEIWDSIDFADFSAKINYYAAAMTAWSVASPFRAGGLWEIRGRVGKSLRTYRRSVIAPPIEIHPHENRRLEFKVFDMNPNLNEMEAYFLLFLTLILDPDLPGRASSATRIYDAGAVAVEGWNADQVWSRGGALLESAQKVLPRWGFSAEALGAIIPYWEKKRTPADALETRYRELNSDLPALILERSQNTLLMK